MKNNLVKITVGILLITTCSNISVSAATITKATINFLNNSSESSYKVDKDFKEDTKDKLSISSEQVEEESENTKDIKSNNEKISWLLENDIISNDVSIQSDGINISTSKIDNVLSSDTDNNTMKSDAVMALCKSIYGIQKSRVLVLNTKSNPIMETAGSDVYDYSEGSYNIYTSPNVYELYFKLLLDKSIIALNEFKNLGFRDEYNSISNNSYPSWCNNLGLSTNKSSMDNGKGDLLGQSIKIDRNDTGDTSIYLQKPNYFMNENITVIEFLRLAEKLLRLTEKDMTDTEAQTISYKYGVDYLRKLDDASKKTVMYLIARGVINFENTEEFSDLFSPLTINELQTFLYRIANKSARVDFSSLQLTDSDNYWLSKGMYQKTLDVYSTDDFFEDTSVVKNSDIELASRDLEDRNIVIQDGEGLDTFTVTRYFRKDRGFTYNGTSIASLKEGDDIASIDRNSKDSKGREAYKVDFKIKAPSAVTALAVVDSRCMIDGKEDARIASVPSVAKVTDKDNKVITYLPESSLSSIGQDEASGEIVALSDKYLMNTRTGTKALLLDNEDMAMIGNEVIKTDSNMVYGANGEVYYNMEIIVRLMSNKYISDIDDGNIYTSSLNKYQGIVDIRNYSDQSKSGDADEHVVIDKTFISDFDNVRVDSGQDPNSSTALTSKKFFSLLHTQKAISCVYRDIVTDLGFANPAYLIVEWKYVVPENGDCSSTTLNNLYKQYGVRDPNVSQMSNFLNTRPDDRELQNWWDSNIGLSDALCNFIYGTQDVHYFTSGYLCPQVTFLSQGDYSDQEIEDMLKKIPLKSDYVNKYVTNSNYKSSLFGSSGSGLYGNLSRFRTFKYIKGRDLGESVIEYGDYVQDKTKTVYKSYGKFSDNDPTNDGLETTMQDFSDGGNNSAYYIKQVCRSNISLKSIFKSGETYRYNNEDYVYVKERNIDGVIYNEMALKTPLKGSIDDSSGYWIFKSDDGQTLSEWVNSRISGNDTQQYFYQPSSAGNGKGTHTELHPKGADDLPESYNLLSYAYTDSEGGYPDSPKTDTNIIRSVYKNDRDSSSTSKIVEDNINPYKSIVYTYPTILIKQDSWTVSNDNELTKTGGSKFLVRNNLINVGLTSAVQDSIIAKNYKYCSTSGIPDGAKVIIGDMNFKAKNGKLYSYPVSNGEIVSRMIGRTDDSTAVMTAVGNLLDGTNITIVSNGSKLTNDNGAYASGVNVSGQCLYDFVKRQNNGTPEINLCENIVNPKQAVDCLSRVGSSMVIINNGNTKSYENGQYFGSFCYSIAFNDFIKFRQMEGTTNTYTIVYSANNNINGAIDNIPFFNTKLDYIWDDDVFNRLSDSEYKPAIDAFGLMDKLKALFDEQRDKDIKNILKMFVMCILSYLFVANLICFNLKKMDLTHTLLDKILNPNGPNSGKDLIKIFSLGLQSLRDETKWTTMLGVNFLLVILMVVVVEYF